MPGNAHFDGENCHLQTYGKNLKNKLCSWSADEKTLQPNKERRKRKINRVSNGFSHDRQASLRKRMEQNFLCQSLPQKSPQIKNVPLDGRTLPNRSCLQSHKTADQHKGCWWTCRKVPEQRTILWTVTLINFWERAKVGSTERRKGKGGEKLPEYFISKWGNEWGKVSGRSSFRTRISRDLEPQQGASPNLERKTTHLFVGNQVPCSIQQRKIKIISNPKIQEKGSERSFLRGPQCPQKFLSGPWQTRKCRREGWSCFSFKWFEANFERR